MGAGDIQQATFQVLRTGSVLTVGDSPATDAPQPSRSTPSTGDPLVIVAVGDDALAALDRLDPLVLRQIEALVPRHAADGGADVHLAVAGSGLPSGGRPALAERLAHALDRTVLGPEGAGLVVPGGHVFSTGAGWRVFSPNRSDNRRPPRVPEPDWQAALLDPAPWTPPDSVRLRALPCGLWLHAAGAGGGDRSGAEHFSELPFLVPPARDRIALVVGRPGEPAPPVTAVADLVESLPEPLRRDLLLLPYGAAAAPLAQDLADALEAPVRVGHGLPLVGDSNRPEVVTVGDDRMPGWVPLVSESRFEPHGLTPEPLAWWVPPGNPRRLGPARYEFPGGWTLHLVPSGLLLRPSGESTDPELVRRPPAPHAPALYIASGAGPVPFAVLSAAAALLRSLPRTTQRDLRIVGLGAADRASLSDLGEALRLPVIVQDLTPAPPEPQRNLVPGDLPEPTTPSSPVVPPPVPPTLAVAHPPTPAPAARSGPAVVLGPDGRPRLVRDSALPRSPTVGNVLPATEPPVLPSPPRPEPAAEHPPLPEPAAIPAPLPEPPPAPEPPQAPEPAPRREPVVMLRPAPIEIPAHSAPPEPARPADVTMAGSHPRVEARRAARREAGPDDRRGFRESLGWRYDAAAQHVARLLAERPALRSAAAAEEGLITDLAAVLVMEAALREQPDIPVADHLLACAAAGLQRLPSYIGCVVHGIPDVSTLVSGKQVVEMRPMMAVADPSVVTAEPAELLIWSVTARRLDGLLGRDAAETVMFVPGSAFRVLSVEPGRTPRVLLREVVPGREDQDRATDDLVTQRLRTVAALRQRNDQAGAA